MHSTKALTPENANLCLINHQPWVAFPIKSIVPEVLTNNGLALAKTALAGLPWAPNGAPTTTHQNTPGCTRSP